MYDLRGVKLHWYSTCRHVYKIVGSKQRASVNVLLERSYPIVPSIISIIRSYLNVGSRGTFILIMVQVMRTG